MKKLACVCVALFAAACGANGSSPSDPTPVVPTVSAPALPNYQGTFSGQYVITSCTSSGVLSLAGVCNIYYPRNNMPYVVTMTQAGNTVTGVISIGTLQSPQWTSLIGSDGTLRIVTRLSDPNSTISARIDLSARITNPGIVGGESDQNWTATTDVGTAEIVGVFTNRD